MKVKSLVIFSLLFLTFHPLFASQEAWDFPDSGLTQVTSVALYRGSFDPLHNGHASIVEKSLESGCSRVFFFPAFGLGEKERTPLSIRTELLELFSEGKEVSVLDFDIAPEMEGDVDTLRRVRQQVTDWIIALQTKGVKVYKVLGGDAAYKEADAFPVKPPSLVDGYILASREGYPITEELLKQYRRYGVEAIAIEPEYQDLSSTSLRQMVEDGQDITPYVPPETL